MRYENVVQGRFLSRPNRFIALVELDGAETVCHVKNTGRCRELLVPGAEVYLAPGVTPGRRTPYDLVAVNKGGRLINMDAQAPNRAFAEFARTFDPQAESIRPEFRFGESRLDFCLTRPDGLHLVEVKGVTLEQGGHARFPDAPTERGVKHVHELIRAVEQGCRATPSSSSRWRRSLILRPTMIHIPHSARPCGRRARRGSALPLTAAVLRRTPCISITLCRWFCEESVRMTLLEIFLIGIGLSMDAFAVAICKGLAMPDKVHKRSAFLIALYFGVFQAVMPALGWLLGSQFAHYVTRFAPWIAFALLAWIGGNMIRESRTEEEEDEQPSDGQVKHKELFVLAVATSIDALAVGVTFSMVELSVSIWLAVCLIGCTTFLISLGGVYVGNVFGAKYKNKAEFVGGTILILIGVKIILEHFGVL